MKVAVTCKFRQAHAHVKGYWSAGRFFPVGERIEFEASEREVAQLEADAPHNLELEFPAPPEPPKAEKKK